MKHLTKLVLILFGLLLTTFACQKDDVNTENQQQTIDTVSYKKLALDDIEELQPVVNNIKKLTPKVPVGALGRDFSFLSLDSLDTENIIEYTDTTSYSTWTFKMNGLDNTINFENLHLLETDDGYMGYILSYEPDENWYNNHLEHQHDEYVLDMADYTGHITKFSLDREIIWSSKSSNENESSASRAGEFVMECSVSIQMMCTCNQHDQGNFYGCNCLAMGEVETCQSVWSSGGTNGNNNGDNDNNNGGSSSNNDDCGDSGTTGTVIQGSVPLTGIGGGCAPNDVIGVIPDEEIIECNVAPAIENMVYSCLIENSFEQPEIHNFLNDEENNCIIWTISEYLNENNCSEEARNNIIEDIETFSLASIFEFNVDNLTNDCTKIIVRDDIIGTGDPVNANLINTIRNTFNFDENVTLNFTNTIIPSDVDVSASTDFDTQEDINSGIYSIQITIDDIYLEGNPTKLSIALTVIHEMVHAKLMYAYLHGILLTEYPEFTDLNSKFENFLDDRTSSNGIALEESMHKAMVSLISTMSYSLYRYAQHKGMDNITEQYCKDITKGSFYGTPSAMELIDTGENTPEELKDKFIDEQDNTTNAKGDDC